MGWSLEERRGRLVDAAVQLAADRGVEHLSLRAAADMAGMSWDTARDSFEDHADLLRAVSTAVTRRNVSVGRVDVADPSASTSASTSADLAPNSLAPNSPVSNSPVSNSLASNSPVSNSLAPHETAGTFEDEALSVALRSWEALTSDRELQLVSYEIAVLALRRTALRPLAAGQQDDQRALAEQILTELAERTGVVWDRPVADVARFLAVFLDGLTTSWLVDGDQRAAQGQLTMLVRALAAFVEVPS